MRRGDLPGAFGGVVDDVSIAVDMAKAGQRKIVRRVQRPLLPLRIDGTEVEHVVPLNWSADRRACIVELGGSCVDRAVDGGHGAPRVFEAVRMAVPERTAAE